MALPLRPGAQGLFLTIPHHYACLPRWTQLPGSKPTEWKGIPVTGASRSNTSHFLYSAHSEIQWLHFISTSLTRAFLLWYMTLWIYEFLGRNGKGIRKHLHHVWRKWCSNKYLFCSLSLWLILLFMQQIFIEHLQCIRHCSRGLHSGGCWTNLTGLCFCRAIRHCSKGLHRGRCWTNLTDLCCCRAHFPAIGNSNIRVGQMANYSCEKGAVFSGVVRVVLTEKITID